MRKLLEKINEIRDIEFQNIDDDDDWNGTLSLSGIKRMIYGIWHNGENELGDSLLEHFPKPAADKYKELIEEYKDKPEIKVSFAVEDYSDEEKFRIYSANDESYRKSSWVLSS